MSEEPRPQPQPPPPTYALRRTFIDKQGRRNEMVVMDPLGHRMHDPVRSPWADEFSKRYPGLVNNKALMFGHLKEKERENMYLQAEAYVKLCDAAERIPSWRRIADAWFTARIEARAEISMGIEGQAIQSENTKRNININREDKPSRWSLRR